MAISKLILNGETQMDVTSNTNTSNNMLSGVVGTKNDGTTVTGNIASKSSTDLTVSGATVTAPAGYYANAASKAVATTTHPNPSASIASSTGVVTASHTQTTGYVTAGTTTGTLNLTTQAATTYNTSTADQTIASNRWLTGTQTIKSVTTSNLTAANIAEGVTVQVGDANNASRITQVTGTHSGATSYTATISGSGNSSYCYVTYNGTKYYYDGSSFTFKAGDTLTIYCRGNYLDINGSPITLSNYSYTYTLPIGDINIVLNYGNITDNGIFITTYLVPSGTLSITSGGDWYVYQYENVFVNSGSAFPPATTITTNPTFSMNSATGVVTASYTGSSSITPTVTSGWVSQGTAGIISTTGTSTYQLTSQAAATYYPSTADQTIASQRWLVGNQTIKSVTTSNLTAENIAEGVVVQVGDSANASRITQITGIHKGGPTYTATLISNGTYDNHSYVYNYVRYNNINYYRQGDTFEFSAGDILTCKIVPYNAGTNTTIYEDGEIKNQNVGQQTYSYTLPAHDINISFLSTNSMKIIVYPTLSITTNGNYDVKNYGYADVSLPTQAAQTFYTSTVDQTISSGVYLTGDQTIKGVTTSNLTAANIASGVTVKIGDSGNASRIAQITGTYGGEYYNAYKTIALKSSIYSSNTDIVSYFSTISSIIPYQFEDICMSGSFTFPVCTTIGDGGFQHTGYNHCLFCTFDFPEVVSIGIFAFKLQSRLTSINAPKATEIKTQAFMSCTSLQTVNFPQVTSIGDSAFFDCRALTTVSFPEALYMYTSAFNGCQNLSSISFPKISQIGMYAFARCYSLTTADFPSTTSIGAYAFQSCSNLTTANFPSATSIGQLAFYQCSNLSSISFPNTTYIGSSTFYGCIKLIEASFPKLSEIELYAFGNCSSLTTANFASATLVSNGGFNNCINLTTISFPELLTIQSSAFGNCSALTTVDFPKVTVVSISAFRGCTNLTTASFPNAVSIATSAFYSCYHLLSLYLLGSSVVSLAGTGAFLYTPISTYTTSTGGVYGSIFVPASLYNSYITATNWSIYSSRIVSV